MARRNITIFGGGQPIVVVAPIPTITFTNPSVSIAEGNSNQTLSNTLTVARNGLTGVVVVNLSYGGTATSGTDYVAGPISATLGAGVSTLSFDLTINGDSTVEPDETIIITAMLAGYTATATKTITLTNDDSSGIFTSQPSISTDGSPIVGEIAAFDFGTVSNGTIGAKRLFKNGADFADASAGSYQWNDAATYKLRVFIAGTSTFADSPDVVVAAAAVTSVPAPTLSMATVNSDGSPYTAGTNPPIVDLTVPIELDKTLYRAILYYDQPSAAGDAFAMSESRKVTIEDLQAAADAEDFTFTGFGSTVAGLFRAQAFFQKLSDGSNGPISARLSTTLNAPSLPPAATQLDLQNKSSGIAVTEVVAGGGDYRIATGTNQGADHGVSGTTTRTDARFFSVIAEMTGIEQFPGSETFLNIGIAPSASSCPNLGKPTGEVGAYFSDVNAYDYGTWAAGNQFVFAWTPATNGSNGTWTCWKAGVQVGTGMHAITSAKLFIGFTKGGRARLNTGQEPFGFTPPNSLRWN